MNLWRRILVERRAIVLPLLVVLVANAAVFILGVLPLRHSVTSAEEESINSRADLARAQRDVFDAKNAQTSTVRADEELKRFYEGVLATSFGQARDVADFWLDRAARHAGVIKKNSTYDYEVIKNSRLVRLRGKVVLEGDYANIKRFLYSAEVAKEFIVIEKVELSQTGVVSNNVGNALAVELELSSYYVQAPGR